MLRKWDAFKTYLFIQGMTSFAFTLIFTMNMVYHVTMVGLNPLQLVLVGTTLEVTAFLFEIPTGVVADVYSRRLSVIIGYFLIGLGFLVESIPTFTTVLMAQVIWGIGYTFTSGAGDAWLVDEIGQERATKAFIRGSQVGQIASFAAIVLSIALALVQLNLPHRVTAITFVLLSLTLILIMPEQGFKRADRGERASWGQMFTTFHEGANLIRLRPILMLIVASTFILGLYSEAWDRLWTAHFLTGFGLPPATNYETVLIFGAMSMVGSLISLVASEAVRQRNLQSNRELSTALAFTYLFIGLGILAFALAGQLWFAIAALWFVGVVRTVSSPLQSAWINQHTDSNVRATVLSIDSQANAIGQIAGGPILGYLGTLYGLRVVLSISGLLIMPAVWIVARTRNMAHKVQEAIA